METVKTIFAVLLGNRSEWHVVERYRRVTLTNGTVSSDHYLWGRKVNGVWSYRELSPDEYNTHIGEIAL